MNLKADDIIKRPDFYILYTSIFVLRQLKFKTLLKRSGENYLFEPIFFHDNQINLVELPARQEGRAGGPHAQITQSSCEGRNEIQRVTGLPKIYPKKGTFFKVPINCLFFIYNAKSV